MRVRISFRVLVCAVAVTHGAAQAQNADSIVDVEIIVHADTALGRGHLILVVMVSVDVEHRGVSHCHEERKVSGA